MKLLFIILSLFLVFAVHGDTGSAQWDCGDLIGTTGYGVGPDDVIHSQEAWIVTNGKIQYCYTLAHPRCFSPVIWKWEEWITHIKTFPKSTQEDGGGAFTEKAEYAQLEAGVWVIANSEIYRCFLSQCSVPACIKPD